MLTVKQVITKMEQLSEQKRGFSLTFCTADRRRPDESGRIITIDNAILSKADRTLPQEIRQAVARDERKTLHSKNPSHDEHGTVNVHKLGSREIRKVHTWLILNFNGQDVL